MIKDIIKCFSREWCCIRNHQVVAEWHALLNPQRTIPFKIVQLTGITNDMVRDAPLFSEIAESFLKYMGDGIFVAHFREVAEMLTRGLRGAGLL
jgi:DNA polymerase III epsilon subunit-like protein